MGRLANLDSDEGGWPSSLYKVGLFEADIGLMISLLGATVVYTFARLNLLCASTFASSFRFARASGGWPFVRAARGRRASDGGGGRTWVTIELVDTVGGLKMQGRGGQTAVIFKKTTGNKLKQHHPTR
jgi:hypothetical protein